ncbi:hypothetical protein Emed_005014 [Eimeria media]
MAPATAAAAEGGAAAARQQLLLLSASMLLCSLPQPGFMNQTRASPVNLAAKASVIHFEAKEPKTPWGSSPPTTQETSPACESQGLNWGSSPWDRLLSLEPMSITAQLLGTHRLSVAPSIHIFCEGPRLLVNAGENVQRLQLHPCCCCCCCYCWYCCWYHLEKKLHIHRTTDVFVTSLSPRSTAGLVGLLLSLEGTGASSVTVWGPHAIRTLLELAKKSFAGLHQLEINFRLTGPPEAPPSLSDALYCTHGVCSGGCRPRNRAGSFTGSSGSSSTSSNTSRSKGPRTCACSYGPCIKGTASGIPVEAYFLPHSSRQQQQQAFNPLLGVDEASATADKDGQAAATLAAQGAAAAADVAAADASPKDLSSKRRKVDVAPHREAAAAATAAAESAEAGAAAGAADAATLSSSSSMEAAKAALFADFKETADCVFLLLRCPTLPGRFFPEKAKALGIPPGPAYARLKGGERIQLGDGRWIDPSEVCSEPHPGKAFAFVECLEPQQAVKAAECFGASEVDSLAGVFHLSPLQLRSSLARCTCLSLSVCLAVVDSCCHGKPLKRPRWREKVAQSPEYAALIKALSSAETKHVFCNLCVPRLNHLLHVLMPPLFPRRRETTEETTSEQLPSPLALPSSSYEMLRVEPLTKLWLSPPTRPFIDEAQKPAEHPLNFFEVRRRESEEAAAGAGASVSRKLLFPRLSSYACTHSLFTPEALEELKEAFSRHLPPPVSGGFKGPALRILGTGSAAPSQYRNVSASILQLTEGLSVALDFGEGSLSQLRGATETEEEFLQLLLSLHTTWQPRAAAAAVICMGTIHICAGSSKRIGLSEESAKAALWPTARPPLLIAPSRLQVCLLLAWFALASEQMAAMPHEFVSCDCLLASADEPFSPAHLPPAAAAAWTGEAAALAIRTVEVDHIPESYGVRLDFKGVSLVYSGDTRPSPQLFALAANCTALLHEATFEDGLHAEAVEKKHSCIGEVLAGATQCGCEAIILTHFSQRYPKIPQLPQSERALLQEAGECCSDLEASSAHKPPVLYAFDGIFLPLQHLSLIAPCFSLLPPVVEKVFGPSAQENAQAEWLSSRKEAAVLMAGEGRRNACEQPRDEGAPLRMASAAAAAAAARTAELAAATTAAKSFFRGTPAAAARATAEAPEAAAAAAGGTICSLKCLFCLSLKMSDAHSSPTRPAAGHLFTYTPLPLVYPPIDPPPGCSIGTNQQQYPALQQQGQFAALAAAAAATNATRQQLLQRMRQACLLHQRTCDAQQPSVARSPVGAPQGPPSVLEADLAAAVAAATAAGGRGPSCGIGSPLCPSFGGPSSLPDILHGGLSPATGPPSGGALSASGFPRVSGAGATPVEGGPSDVQSWMERHRHALGVAEVYDGQLRLWRAFAAQLQLYLLLATQEAAAERFAANAAAGSSSNSSGSSSSPDSGQSPPTPDGVFGARLSVPSPSTPSSSSEGRSSVSLGAMCALSAASSLDSSNLWTNAVSPGAASTAAALAAAAAVAAAAAAAFGCPGVSMAVCEAAACASGAAAARSSTTSAAAQTDGAPAAAASPGQVQQQQQRQQQQQQQQQAPWRLRFIVMYLKLLVLLFLFDAGKWVYVACLFVALLHTNGAFNPILNLITSTSHRQPFEATLAQLRRRRERRPLQQLRLQQQRLHASLGRPLEGGSRNIARACLPADCKGVVNATVVSTALLFFVAAAGAAAPPAAANGDTPPTEGDHSSSVAADDSSSSSSSSSGREAWASSMSRGPHELRERRLAGLEGQGQQSAASGAEGSGSGAGGFDMDGVSPSSGRASASAAAAAVGGAPSGQRRRQRAAPPYWKRALYQGVAMFFLTTIPWWNPDPELLIDFEGIEEDADASGPEAHEDGSPP